MTLTVSQQQGPARGSATSFEPPNASLRAPVVGGCLILLAFFGGFGAWAAMAPLNGAVVGEAIVKVSGNRKSVQHLEGGIIKALYVKDGDLVRQGDVMIALNADQAQADYDVLSRQMVFLTAADARLETEAAGLDKVTFPPALLHSGSSDAEEAMRNQRDEFDGRRAAVNGQMSILRAHISQLTEQADGQRSQAAAYRSQLASVLAEKDSLQGLLTKGFIPRTRILQLQRTADGLNGQIAGAAAAASQGEAAIVEDKRRIDQLDRDRVADANRDRREIQWKLLDVAPRIANARDRLERSLIRAPYSGAVVAQSIFSIGGVIAPGERLLDIVPDGNALAIDARLAVHDISEIHRGMKAEVHFTAYVQKRMPIIHGSVTEISADRLTDERTQAPYYLATVEVDQNDLAASSDIQLYPGMPATVMITTTERSALSYLISPLSQSFNRAFRER